MHWKGQTRLCCLRLGWWQSWWRFWMYFRYILELQGLWWIEHGNVKGKEESRMTQVSWFERLNRQCDTCWHGEDCQSRMLEGQNQELSYRYAKQISKHKHAISRWRYDLGYQRSYMEWRYNMGVIGIWMVFKALGRYRNSMVKMLNEKEKEFSTMPRGLQYYWPSEGHRAKRETERKPPEWKLKEEYVKKEGMVTYISWDQVRWGLHCNIKYTFTMENYIPWVVSKLEICKLPGYR